MKITAKQIITSVILITTVSILSSFLNGNSTYLKQLTASLMLRNQMNNLKIFIENEKKPPVSLFIDGDRIFEDELRKEIRDRAKLEIAQNSKYSIQIKINEREDILTSTVSFNKNSHELATNTESSKLGKWFSILPPIVAIILAVCLRQVILSLGIGIWFGAMLNSNFNPLTATWDTAYKYLFGSLVGEFSILILAFVFALVAMTNIINLGGGMAGIVNQITKIAKSAKTSLITSSILGILIFFDDYLNTIVVGTTMRSFTDKMKVSREKLAYIVDSTSAPVAGLFIISTWIGFEVLQIHNVAEFLGLKESGYELFLKALPYRFYCIFALVFVFLTSILRRDFGPMLKAERRAFIKGQPDEPGTNINADSMINELSEKKAIPERWYNAAIPVMSVLIFIITAILIKGSEIAKNNGLNISIFSISGIKECFIKIGGDGNTLFIYLFYAALTGLICSIILMLAQKILTPKEIFRSIIAGWKILPAASILIFAWGIQKVCNDLGTAVYISSLVKDILNPLLLPLIIILLSATIAFSTGTSFGTMGLVFPTIAPLAMTLGNPLVFIISIGSVLDGAIFGDHCSPISDTTVLSSISSSCSLIDHVKTQLPYAVLCMIVAAVIGYLPAALGMPSLLLYAFGIALLTGFLMLFGKNPEKSISD